MTGMLKLTAGGFRLIRRDAMLGLLLAAPWLAGAALGLGLPLLAPILLTTLKFDLTAWYPLADMLMLSLTPMMVGTLAAFLMLDERDEGVGSYYDVTPIGGAGYLFSRLALPVLWSVLVAPLLMAAFSLSHPSLARVLAVALVGGLSASSSALLLLALSGNKVEGLAVSKMMGVLVLPIVLPFITGSPWAMLAGVFPAYWMGALLQGPLWMLIPGVAVSIVWLWVTYRRTVNRRR
jgi:fluoroquinolone transport system permease protein